MRSVTGRPRSDIEHVSVFLINLLSTELEIQLAVVKNNMAKCIKCGAEVGTPKKRWKMTGRPDKAGKRMQMEIGLFECPKCHTKFRVALSKQKI